MFGPMCNSFVGGDVAVTSFNEWHEGTQIEEASPRSAFDNYGPLQDDGYLQLTVELALSCGKAVAN
jgi:hypothetical protein